MSVLVSIILYYLIYFIIELQGPDRTVWKCMVPELFCLGLATIILSIIINHDLRFSYPMYCITVVRQLATPTVWCVQNWLYADTLLSNRQHHIKDMLVVYIYSYADTLSCSYDSYHISYWLLLDNEIVAWPIQYTFWVMQLLIITAY